MDCDTGKPAAPGEYPLSDKTHAQLLEALVKDGLRGFTPELRDQHLAFYAQAQPPNNRKELRAWRRTTQELQALKAGPARRWQCRSESGSCQRIQSSKVLKPGTN